jgi:hypothetical protein
MSPRRRLPFRDPRTVARDIPGILDAIFPQLNAGLVAHLNKDAVSFPELQAIPQRVLEDSMLNRAMLFELSVARAEQMLKTHPPDWEQCLSIALTRQRRHFDAVLPTVLMAADITAADWAAGNLVEMIRHIGEDHPEYALTIAPEIPGYRWIASGNADFCFGPLLIEVKHTSTSFLSRDFRQVLMYWILSYAAAIERGSQEFSDCILINPRKNSALAIRFSKLLRLASSGLSKIEVIQLFDSIVGDHLLKMDAVGLR